MDCTLRITERQARGKVQGTDRPNPTQAGVLERPDQFLVTRPIGPQSAAVFDDLGVLFGRDGAEGVAWA
jgi:hypothetical protein